MPPEIIRKKLADLGWTQSDLAYVVGSSVSSISPLLSGKRGITAKMAVAIGAALELDAVELARLQAEIDVANAPSPTDALLSRARIQRSYPLREMIRREWINESSDPLEVEASVCDFFGVDGVKQIPHIAHSAKRTSSTDSSPALLAWVYRARQIAEEMPTPTYSNKKLSQSLEKLSLMLGNREEVRFVPRLMHEAGVRFVIVEGLPSSKIDGACFWLDEQSPVIAMSTRFDRIDNFWFVFRHECAHVLHGHGKDQPKIDADIGEEGYEDSADEQIANSEAAEWCIPQKKIDSFYIRKGPLFSERDVLAFAKINKVHPGIVVGQLHKRMDRHNFLRAHQVPIREILLSESIVDGFGHISPVS